MKLTDELRKRYWDGRLNRFIRYLFYINRGMDEVINRYRNLGIVIFGICITLKITSWKFMVIAAIVGIVLMGICGYIHIHFLSKNMDFYSNYFGTHYSSKSLELQEETLVVLKELKKEKNGNPNNHPL